MQTIIKKWDNLSKEEVERIFSLRSEVLIRVEKTNLEKKHIDFKILSKSE